MISSNDLKIKIKNIVEQANILKNQYLQDQNTPVNYACIFSHSQKEYIELLEVAQKIGKVIKQTPTGPLFHLKPLATVSGTLKLLKIRLPDSQHPELGDADFTISNFSEFIREYLPQNDFKLIQREDFNMIELCNNHFNVRAYFSHPPLDEQLNIK